MGSFISLLSGKYDETSSLDNDERSLYREKERINKDLASIIIYNNNINSNLNTKSSSIREEKELSSPIKVIDMKCIDTCISHIKDTAFILTPNSIRFQKEIQTILDKKNYDRNVFTLVPMYNIRIPINPSFSDTIMSEQDTMAISRKTLFVMISIFSNPTLLLFNSIIILFGLYLLMLLYYTINPFMFN